MVQLTPSSSFETVFRPDSRAPHRRSRCPVQTSVSSSQRLSVGTFAIPVMGSQLSNGATDSIILDSTVFQPDSRAPHRRSPPRCRHRCHRRDASVGTFAIPVMGSQLSTVHENPSSGSSGVPAWQSSTASQVSVPGADVAVVAEAVGRDVRDAGDRIAAVDGAADPVILDPAVCPA